MPLRVAFTHAFCWPEVRRGGERYLHELAGAMARRGHKVTIIAGAPAPAVTRIEGVRVIRLPRGTGTDTFQAERRFGKLVGYPLALGRFDVVHSLGARDAAAAIDVKGRKHRTVYTNLGLPLRESWDNRPDGAAHQHVVDDADVYGCLSWYTQSLLQRDYGREGVVTPGGVRLDRFQPTAARAKEPTLLYSGALTEPRKNVAVLLEAVAILAKTEPRVKLWLSGPGDPTALISDAPAAARKRTEVLSLGTIDDQPDRYAAAWATVYPTRNEAFGLVLVESLACGTPIVGTDHASLPELIEPGIGTTAKVDDPQSLAVACAEALELSRQSDIRDRCRTAALRHDWDAAVAPHIESLYLSDARF